MTRQGLLSSLLTAPLAVFAGGSDLAAKKREKID
jgi:hypothetical protein